MKAKKSATIHFVFFAVTVLLNYLVATGKIPGLGAQQEVSRMYPTTITPAGFTFSIWGVIYACLFLAILYMWRGPHEDAEEYVFRNITPFLWGLFVFNILWNIVFGAEMIGLSVIMILGYWICLYLIGKNLLKGTRRLSSIMPMAFGIHMGWITIATIVNFYAFLTKIGWGGFGLSADLWTLIALVVAVVATFALQVVLRNAVLPLSVAWAFFGIYQKGAEYADLRFLPVVLLIGIVFLVALAMWTFFRNDRRLIPIQKA